MCTNNKNCNCSCGSSYGGHPRPMLTYANGGQLYRLTQADLKEYNRKLGSRKSMALGGLSGSRQVNEVNVGNSTNPFDYGQGQYGNVDTSFRDRKEGTFGEEVKDVGRTALKAQAGIAKGALDTLSYVVPGQAGEGLRQLNDQTLGRLSDANLGETSSKEQKRRTKIGDYSELGSEVLVGVAGTALTGDPRFAFAAAQSAGDTLGSDIDPGNKTLSTIGTGLQTAGGMGSTIYGATGGGGGGDFSEAFSGANTTDIANSVEGGSDIVNATDAASSLPFAEGGDIKRLEAYMGSVREMAKGGQVNRKFLDANKIMAPGGPTDPPKYNTAPASSTAVNIQVPIENVQPQLNEPAVSPYASQEYSEQYGTISQGPKLGTNFVELMTNGPGQQPLYMTASGRKVDDNYYEPTIENFVEFFDPTGAYSYDDANAAYERMKARGADTPNFDEALDMFGAIPLVGKAKHAFVLAKGTRGAILLALQKAKVPFNKFLDWADHVNKADAIEDETDFLNKFQDWLKTVPPMSDNSSNTSPTNKMALGGRTNSPKKKISYEGRVPSNRKNSI